mmetsp:Transcript_7191/g.8312  ORF Transcript_7191/g.8312 Transcript_7191/m.8312 type:complete len:166 (-) Transcript_7191:572-1069(-)|eukprot:CAMPEP_0197853934 /NCGR_PEP_ID=MMETSP1438-20131217/23726_1 /TAXON_ID=1461541 /ORGANISM="Pterosperma sp., Strain CCMP1384" /LENGTH=165 /DNA_ID=CAMNT_0043468515 /DNA_START=80 /DNA_END=577 /DNA_ORIENTATION=-
MALRGIRTLIPYGRSALNGTRAFATASDEAHALCAAAGTPELVGRKAEIYSPARSAGQQGKSKTGNWQLRFETTEKWENPLMGWTSSGDALYNMAELQKGMQGFTTVEEATRFCEQRGIDYKIRYPKTMVKLHPATIKGAVKGVPKAYADNFSTKRKGVPNYPGH